MKFQLNIFHCVFLACVQFYANRNKRIDYGTEFRKPGVTLASVIDKGLKTVREFIRKQPIPELFHECTKDKGCKKLVYIIDGCEKLQRIICSMPRELLKTIHSNHIFNRIFRICASTPIIGNKKQRRQRYCKKHLWFKYVRAKFPNKHLNEFDSFEIAQIHKYDAETDKYLVQWQGYSERTWEPAAHIPTFILEQFERNNKVDIELINELQPFYVPYAETQPEPEELNVDLQGTVEHDWVS